MPLPENIQLGLPPCGVGHPIMDLGAGHGLQIEGLVLEPIGQIFADLLVAFEKGVMDDLEQKENYV